MPKIIDLLLKNSSVIIDFGAGDGTVIFATAQKAFDKKLPLQFYAVEINPILILTLHLRRLFHPNKKNIFIIWEDMFKINLKHYLSSISKSTAKIKNIIIYLYISPWSINKLLHHLKTHFSSFDSIVFLSYFYPIKTLKKKEKIIKGVNKIYLYQ